MLLSEYKDTSLICKWKYYLLNKLLIKGLHLSFSADFYVMTLNTLHLRKHAKRGARPCCFMCFN